MNQNISSAVDDDDDNCGSTIFFLETTTAAADHPQLVTQKKTHWFIKPRQSLIPVWNHFFGTL